MDVFFQNNPSYAVLDIKKLYPIISREIPNISIRHLKDYLDKRNNVYGYKLQPKKFLRIASMSYTWQVDIMFHKRGGRMFIYFVGIEINSRLGYIKRISNNTSDNLKECLKILMELKQPVYKFIGDDEFNNNTLLNFCLEKHVKLYTFVAKDIHRYPGNQLAYVDRFIRTLRWYNIKINKPNTDNFTAIVEMYNNSPHSSLKDYYIQDEDIVRTSLSPNDVVDDRSLLMEIHTDNLSFNNRLHKKMFSNFAIGDTVRYLIPRDEDRKIRPKQKSMLSQDIFKIIDIKKTGFILQNVITGDILKKQYNATRNHSLFKPYEVRKVKIYDTGDSTPQSPSVDDNPDGITGPHRSPSVDDIPGPSNYNIDTAPPPNRVERQHVIRQTDHTQEGISAMAEIGLGNYLYVNIYKLNETGQLIPKKYKILRVVPTGEDNENNDIIPVILEIKINTQTVLFKLNADKYRKSVEDGWNLTNIFAK